MSRDCCGSKGCGERKTESGGWSKFSIGVKVMVMCSTCTDKLEEAVFMEQGDHDNETFEFRCSKCGAKSCVVLEVKA